jgi:hypothetical protein
MTFSIENIGELLKKHGVWVIVALYLNNKVEAIEEQLYDCYEARIIENKNPITDRKLASPERTYAILPSKCKTVKECLA